MPKKFSMKDLLNEHSKAETKTITPAAASGAAETPIAASGAASGFGVVDIPIGQIELSPSNQYNIRDIEELAASIETLGLLHNLVVKPLESGQYELISGERRLLALKLLDWQTVPCKVESGGSEALQELKLIHANAMARVLTDYEKTMQAARLKEILQQMKTEGYKFKGRMRDIVAEILKISSAQMGRIESIERHLSQDLKAEFEAGNIGISAAYEASTMPPEAQAAAYEAYKETGQLDTGKQRASGQADGQSGTSWTQRHEAQQDEREEAAAAEMERAAIERMKQEAASKAPTDEDWAYVAGRAEREAAAANDAGFDEDERDLDVGYAQAWLHEDGKEVGFFTGKLVLVAVVKSDDEHGGMISADGGVSGMDYAALIKVVCEECITRIEDGAAIDDLRAWFAALFDDGQEA